MLRPQGTLPALVLGLAIMASAHDVDPPIYEPPPPPPADLETEVRQALQELRQQYQLLLAERTQLAQKLGELRRQIRMEEREPVSPADEETTARVKEMVALEYQIKGLDARIRELNERRDYYAEKIAAWAQERMRNRTQVTRDQGSNPHRDYHEGVIPKPTPPGVREYHRDNLPDLEL